MKYDEHEQKYENIKIQRTKNVTISVFFSNMKYEKRSFIFLGSNMPTTRTPNYESRRYPKLSFILSFGKCLTYIPIRKKELDS